LFFTLVKLLSISTKHDSVSIRLTWYKNASVITHWVD
jgi:hypothetical protein